MYILDSGQVSVYMMTGGRSPPGALVKTLSLHGDVFGELAVSEAVTVIADASSLLWTLDRDTYESTKEDSVQQMGDK